MLTTFISSTLSVNAATATGGFYSEGFVYKCTLTTYVSEVPEMARQLPCLGFKKTKYTKGSVTVSATTTETFGTSATVDAKYKGVFVEVGGSVGVSASIATSTTVGTTLNVEANAPNGYYYAFVGVLQKKVKFQVMSSYQGKEPFEQCYSKTYKYAPKLKSAFLDVRKVS